MRTDFNFISVSISTSNMFTQMSHKTTQITLLWPTYVVRNNFQLQKLDVSDDRSETTIPISDSLFKSE